MTDAFDLDRIGGRKALDALIDEITEAGEKALAMQKSGVGNHARRKPDNSPVTEADEAVERHIKSFLLSRFEGFGFLGEETGSTEGESEMRFIVDPIDGTRAFTRGFDTWSVLVGLECEGDPVVGIAFMPAAGDLMVAVKGDGARKNGKRLHVTAVDHLEDAVVSHGGLHQFTDACLEDVLTKLGRDTYTQRGHVDFDGYRQLLSGMVDVMVDPGVKAWDICPAAVLVREAGGRFSDFKGNETIHGANFLATNGLLHDAMLEVLR
jgi:histidinol-phosphatase